MNAINWRVFLAWTRHLKDTSKILIVKPKVRSQFCAKIAANVLQIALYRIRLSSFYVRVGVMTIDVVDHVRQKIDDV